MKRVGFIFLLALGACDKENPVTPPPPPPTVSGSWTGSSTGISVSLTLSQSGTAVSGNGQMTGTTSVAVTVSGTHVYPNVSLNLSIPGYSPTNYSAQLTTTILMTGKLNGSGFVDFALNLSKQ